MDPSTDQTPPQPPITPLSGDPEAAIKATLGSMDSVNANMDAIARTLQPKMNAAAAGANTAVDQAGAANKQATALVGQMAAPQAAPDLKQKKLSAAALLGTLFVGAMMGKVSGAGAWETAAKSLNATNKAFKENDQESAKRALDQWKASNETIKMQNETLRDRIADIRDTAKTDLTLAQAKLDIVQGEYASMMAPETAKLTGLEKRLTAMDSLVKMRQSAADHSETARHDKAMEGIDRMKAEQGTGWKMYSDATGGAYRANPNAGIFQKSENGAWRDVPSLPADVFPTGTGMRAMQPTVSEEKVGMNYQTAKWANDKLDQAPFKNMNLSFLSTVTRDEDGYFSATDRLGRNRALTPDEQMMATLAAQFAEGGGHAKSGARINQTTMQLMQQLYLPMPGDSPQTRDLKAQARMNDLESMRIGGGRAVKAYEREHPPGAPAGKAATLPPEAVSKLQEGHITTFGNGQKWTLKNGQPEQVQ